MQILLLKPEDLPHFEGLYFDGAFPCSETELLLGAVDDQQQPPVGMGLLAAGADRDALLVDWLFVAPDYRRKGVATALLDTLTDAARQDPEVESITAFAAEDDGLLSFLDQFGFAVLLQENRGCYRSTLGQLRELRVPELPQERIMALRDVPAFMLRSLNSMLAQGELRNCGVSLPIRPGDYAPQSAVTCEDGKITAMVLLEQQAGEIHIDWAFALPRHQRDFAGLLRWVSQQLKAELPPETPLVMGTLGPAGDNLVQNLLPEAEWEPLYAAVLTWEEDT